MQSRGDSVDIHSYEETCGALFVVSENTFVLSSPDASFEVEFAAKKEDEGVRRTYSLFDKKQGATTPDVWGSRDSASQGVLAARLIAFSQYRVVRVIAGWRLVCEKCGRTDEEGTGAGLPPRKSSKCATSDCRGALRLEQVSGARNQCAEPLVRLEMATRHVAG